MAVRNASCLSAAGPVDANLEFTTTSQKLADPRESLQRQRSVLLRCLWMPRQLNWFQQDLLIWVPNILGSTLFLASGYLAFIETCHAYWAWRPISISWWVVFANLLGCVGFMISAVFAISLPTGHAEAVTTSIAFTLIGAIGFLVGSLLMLPETVKAD